MDKKRLSDSLKELQDALKHTTTISDSDRQRLERLQANIAEKLKQEERAEDEDDTLVEDLVDAIQEFEVSHPQLTMVLGHLMNILSQSGV